MLVGLAGLLSGYDGSFEFKSGEVYPDTLHYTPWRMMLATYGVLMVPVAWYTAHGLGWNKLSVHLVTLMVLFGEPTTLLLLGEDRALTEWISSGRRRMAHDLEVHPAGLDAPPLHLHHRSRPR